MTAEGPTVYEVEVIRLVTFIVSVEDLRNERASEYDDDEGAFDPQQAAEEFIDGMVGAPVDNYATIHEIEPAPWPSEEAQPTS
jgi:hypothetical protein